MDAVIATGYIPPAHGTHQNPELHLIPHALPILYAGLFLALLALLLWREHVAFVKGCTCQKDRGTFLKPKWKRYDKKGRE